MTDRKYPQYVQPEAFTEEQQTVGKKASSLEGYDPSQYDDDVAQAMQGNIKQPQFLDLSDPSKLARPEGHQMQYPTQGQYPPQQQQYPPQQQQYQQQYQQPYQQPFQESYNAAPDIYNAEAKLDQLTSIMDKVNAVAEMTDADGNSTQKFAIAIALKTLKDAIRMLEEVDYWIPQGKEKYVPQLKQIASPIAKALKAYVGSVDKLK